MDRTFSAVSGNHLESLLRHTDSPQWRRSDTSSPSSKVTQQQQGFRSSSSSKKTLRLEGHRRSDGHLITGLLQSSVSGPQTQWFLLTNHRYQEIEPLSRNTFIQDGDSFLDNSSTTVTGMDHQDKLKGCLSSYPGPCEHPEVLSLCYSWKD